MPRPPASVIRRPASVGLVAALSLVVLQLGCPPENLSEAEPDASRSRDAGRVDASTQENREDASTAIPPDASEVEMDAGQTPSGPFWANTQWPPYVTAAPNETVKIYGQVWIPEGTDRTGQMAGLQAEVGMGPSGSSPRAGGWSWSPAVFNKDVGNNDEFEGTLLAPASGVRDYAFRYRVASGAPWAPLGEWLYADVAGVDRAAPDYRTEKAGRLAVRAAGATLTVATLNLHGWKDDPAARLNAAAARFAQLGVDVVALQEIFEDASGSEFGFKNSADYLAAQLSAATGKTWRAVFSQTHLSFDKYPEGPGLVTSLPIAAIEVLQLPPGIFPRKAVLAVLASPAGMVAVVSTHLAHDASEGAVRLAQTQAMLGLADGWQNGAGRPPKTYAVVAGDFNAASDEAAVRALTQASSPFTDLWAAGHPGDPGLTFPSNAPSIRIDYLLARAGSAAPLALDEVQLEFKQPYAGASRVSDHLGVWARLRAP